MSKRMTFRDCAAFFSWTRALATSASLSMLALLLTCQAVAAQDSGFSIFDSPSDAPVGEPSELQPPAVESFSASPNESFVDPAKKPSIEQLGGEASKPIGLLGPRNRVETPKFAGSKAIGEYSKKVHEGQSMFARPPAVTRRSFDESTERTFPQDQSKLTPFASNGLRGDPVSTKEESPSPGSNFPAKIAVEVPQVDQSGDTFQGSARRLGATLVPKVEQVDASPKVAQTTFQDSSSFGRSRTSAFQQGASTAPVTSSGMAGNFAKEQNFNQPLGQGATSTPANSAGRSNFPPRITARNADPRGTDSRDRFAAQPPASGQQPTATPARPLQASGQLNRASQNNATASSSAKALLESWAATKQDTEKLSGKTLTLKNLLAQPINGTRQQAINQYWQTYQALAKHKIALEHANWLAAIPVGGRSADSAVLTAAKQSADAKVLETNIQLSQAQAMLQELLPGMRDNRGKAIAALPSNIPWVGKIKTNYEQYRNRGMVPSKFNGIDSFLVKQRKLIADRHDSVVAAGQAANEASRALASGQTPVANVLEAARMRAQSQFDFVKSVHSYNRAITDYVLSVRQDINQPTQLASVLIGRNAVINKGSKRSKKVAQANPQRKSVLNQPVASNSRSTRAIPASSAQRLSARGQVEQTPPPALSRPSSQTSATVAQNQNQKIEFGPTKESAKAANFDPNNVPAEGAVRQARPNSASSSYFGNQASSGSANRPDRTAMGAAQQTIPTGANNGGGAGSRSGFGASKFGGIGGSGSGNQESQPFQQPAAIRGYQGAPASPSSSSDQTTSRSSSSSASGGVFKSAPSIPASGGSPTQADRAKSAFGASKGSSRQAPDKSANSSFQDTTFR